MKNKNARNPRITAAPLNLPSRKRFERAMEDLGLRRSELSQLLIEAKISGCEAETALADRLFGIDWIADWVVAEMSEVFFLQVTERTFLADYFVLGPTEVEVEVCRLDTHPFEVHGIVGIELIHRCSRARSFHEAWFSLALLKNEAGIISGELLDSTILR